MPEGTSIAATFGQLWSIDEPSCAFSDRQTERQTDRQTDKQRDRETDRER